MSEPRYHIVFSTLIEGRQPSRVYHDLAELFNIDEALVRRIFACQGAVVKNDLDRATAEQYVQVILAAGAICLIEPMPSGPATADAPPSQQAAAGDGPSAPVDSEQQARPHDPDGTPCPTAALRSADTTAAKSVSSRAGSSSAPAFAALLLLAGAAMPLLSGSGQLYWPWLFVFEPQPPGLLWWVLVPAAAALLIALLRLPAFSLAVTITGLAALCTITAVLWEASLIIPLRILPLDRLSALALAAALAGTAVCAGACAAMEELGGLVPLRLLAAGGSLAVILPACAALFSAGAIWHSWPMILLLLILTLLGAMAFACSVCPAVPDALLCQVRLLCRILICWAPAAVLIAHLPPEPPDTHAVLLMAVLKTALLYYGPLLAIAAGLRNEFLYRFEK